MKRFIFPKVHMKSVIRDFLIASIQFEILKLKK